MLLQKNVLSGYILFVLNIRVSQNFNLKTLKLVNLNNVKNKSLNNIMFETMKCTVLAKINFITISIRP